MIPLFRSKGSELRLPKWGACMHGQLAKWKLEVLHMKVYVPWYGSVKRHDQSLIFLVDCDMSGVNKSTEVDQRDNHNSKFLY